MMNESLELSYSPPENFDAYVLDASFCGCLNFENEFKKICRSGKEIIFTSITLNELKKLKTNPNRPASDRKNAGKVYHYILQRYTGISLVNITYDENLTADEQIVQFCVSNTQQKVKLITCDEEMAVSARLQGVLVEFYPQTLGFNAPITTLKQFEELINRYTLNHLDFDFFTFYMVRFANGTSTFNERPKKLSSGDNVYIMIKEDSFYRFMHFKVSNDYMQAQLVYLTTIYKDFNIYSLPRKDYIDFVRQYFLKNDLTFLANL